MKPVPSPAWLPSAPSLTTLTTAGRTALTTPTTLPRAPSIVVVVDGKFARGAAVPPSVLVAVDPVVHADSASAATTPNARRARLMFMSPVCRSQAGFGTRLPHVRTGA